MSNRYQYTTVDKIFAKLDRDVTTEYDEGDIIEWIGEALGAINSVKSFEEEVHFINVKNYQCKIPKGMHAIIQIARYNGNEEVVCSLCAMEAAKECSADFDFAVFNMDGKSLALMPNFNLKLDYSTWRHSHCYSKYSPVRLTNSVFFNSVVCSEREAIYTGNSDEYNIIMGDTLRFSFESGVVALACLVQAVDKETGYPLIPDTYSHTSAILAYIQWKMLNRQCFAGREGACGKADKAEMQWHWYCKQAGNIDMMPYGIDEHQNLLDQRGYLLPNRMNYFGFFGNLSKPEQRPFNNRRY